ncbi:thiolase family protein [Kitasatospora sp. NPDC018058]|uniref:thiolase family protein n=1 Tax=Kitasatospora sp. NPDC018058 TaxID=3364025 RepID=UPI0037C0DDC5
MAMVWSPVWARSLMPESGQARRGPAGSLGPLGPVVRVHRGFRPMPWRARTWADAAAAVLAEALCLALGEWWPAPVVAAAAVLATTGYGRPRRAPGLRSARVHMGGLALVGADGGERLLPWGEVEASEHSPGEWRGRPEQGRIWPAGAYDVVVACGIESMSRVPMWSNVPPGADPFGASIAARYPGGLVPQGVSAELIAAKWSITREAMDEFAAGSHTKAARAHAEGRFADELVPVGTPGGLVTMDESVRPGTTPEVLAGLRPAFADPSYEERFPQISWSVTAGNSSPINDGASAVLITSSETAARLGLRPLARLHSFAVTGSDPLPMLTGVLPATEKVLRRSGLSLADIDLFEVNEAFASVVLAWLQETGADPARLNVNGGAIALGHPLGASGTRLMTTLVHELRRSGGRFALQTMCEAGGLANATILEAIH